jgi:Xaa-Pro aminopeptidase
VKQIDTSLGQLALDLVAALRNAKTDDELGAIQDAIELHDQMMDRLHDAGLAS